MKYEFDVLMIEITRKCNLKCEHCLRGDAQNITMGKEVIDKIFEDAADCKQILFTGGEPLLALDEIEYFVDKILESDWTTKNIAMTINGTIRDRRLIDIANKFCRSREGQTVHIFVSDDEFHNTDESNRTLDFYHKFQTANGVYIVPQEFSIGNKQEEFTLAGRAIKYYENHPQLSDRWFVKKEEQTNHRLCILNDRIPCAMYITALGGFESYVGEDFSTVDRLSYGSILQSSMSELIEKHNNDCVISCHDAYMINYYRNLPDQNDFLSEAISRVYLRIFERFITAREKARKLYPLVTAHDIMVAIPFPDFIIENQNLISEIISISEDLTDKEVEQYADLDLVNHIFSFDNEQTKDLFKIYLRMLALMNKPNTVFAPGKIYGAGNLEDTPEFKKLAALNHQYKVGKLTPDNSANFRCEAVYGKTFRDYEVERIQNSDLPDEIKFMVLRKDEKERKIKADLEKFLTNFVKDFKTGFTRCLNDRNFDPIAEAKKEIANAKHPAIKTVEGLRCGYCGKVIQHQGRNIHCAPVEGGLQCQYCKSLNTV